MIHSDTVKLLRECNAGIKMGIDSIDEVYEKVKDERFKKVLSDCREQHKNLGSETHEMLERYKDEGKDPNPMAKTMSWLKTNVKLTIDGSDATVADLITDGCNMGVKSLNRYLNQYEAAEERAKDIAKRLIQQEAQLAVDIRPYL